MMVVTPVCDRRSSVWTRRSQDALQFCESVRFQFFEGYKFECRRVRRLKIYRCGATVIKSALPTRDANAPFVARLESGKTPLRDRRDKVVAIEHGKIEKLARHFHADSVQTYVFGPGATKAVAIKSSHRILAAALQFRSQNVCRHQHSLR